MDLDGASERQIHISVGAVTSESYLMHVWRTMSGDTVPYMCILASPPHQSCPDARTLCLSFGTECSPLLILLSAFYFAQ